MSAPGQSVFKVETSDGGRRSAESLSDKQHPVVVLSEWRAGLTVTGPNRDHLCLIQGEVKSLLSDWLLLNINILLKWSPASD